MKYLLLVLVLFWPALVHAEGEHFTCDDVKHPPYPAIGMPPIIQTWRPGNVDTVPAAPDCSGLNLRNFTLLVALTGSFSTEEKSDDLLMRFGAISSLRGIRYWSVTDDRWETLITDATALDKSDLAHRRMNFTLEEMKGGKGLYFAESDNRTSSEIIYRMDILKVAPDALSFRMENVSIIRFFLLPLFEPGDLQSVFLLGQISPAVWGYYSLSGIREKGIASIESHEKSYVNRAAAMYRHFIGVPTDQEPPANR